MSFLPEEELKGNNAVNLAPMIDFLFLMVVFFATMAVSRVTTLDTELELVTLDSKQSEQNSTEEEPRDLYLINITVNADGEYKWVTDIHDYVMNTPEEITQELATQHERGALPEAKELTKVLLRIDKKTEWDPILKVIFAIRDAGFQVHPIYQPEADEATSA